VGLLFCISAKFWMLIKLLVLITCFLLPLCDCSQVISSIPFIKLSSSATLRKSSYKKIRLKILIWSLVHSLNYCHPVKILLYMQTIWFIKASFPLTYLNINAREDNRCPIMIRMFFIGKRIPPRPSFIAPRAIHIHISVLNINKTWQKVSSKNIFI
jgi:hypothetical protein